MRRHSAARHPPPPRPAPAGGGGACGPRAPVGRTPAAAERLRSLGSGNTQYRPPTAAGVRSDGLHRSVEDRVCAVASGPRRSPPPGVQPRWWRTVQTLAADGAVQEPHPRKHLARHAAAAVLALSGDAARESGRWIALGERPAGRASLHGARLHPHSRRWCGTIWPRRSPAIRPRCRSTLESVAVRRRWSFVAVLGNISCHFLMLSCFKPCGCRGHHPRSGRLEEHGERCRAAPCRFDRPSCEAIRWDPGLQRWRPDVSDSMT